MCIEKLGLKRSNHFHYVEKMWPLFLRETTTTTITLALEPHHMLIISHAQSMVCGLFKLSWKQEGLISSMPNMQQSKGLHF